MDYINPMPLPKKKYLDIPLFMMKHARFNREMPEFDLKYLYSLLSWAEQEYTDTKEYYRARGDIRRLMTISQLNTRQACARIIAKSEIFGSLLAWASERENWESLPVHFQRFLHEAHVVYQKS